MSRLADFRFLFSTKERAETNGPLPVVRGANSKSGDETPEVLTTRLLFNSATEVDDVWVAGLT